MIFDKQLICILCSIICSFAFILNLSDSLVFFVDFLSSRVLIDFYLSHRHVICGCGVCNKICFLYTYQPHLAVGINLSASKFHVLEIIFISDLTFLLIFAVLVMY